MYWHDERTGARLRCHPDWMTTGGRPIQVDVKTTKSAAPRDFEKSCADYGYHQQQALYVDGLAAHGIETDFLFFAIESTYPYLCSVVELTRKPFRWDGPSTARRSTFRRSARSATTGLASHRSFTESVFPPWAYTAAEATINRLEGTLA